MDKQRHNGQNSIRTYTTRSEGKKQDGGPTPAECTDKRPEAQEDRFSQVCAGMDNKLDNIIRSITEVNTKFDKLEARQDAIEKRFTDMEASLAFGDKERESMKCKLDKLPNIDKLNDEVKQLRNKIDDLENRGRRNNIIFYNIPEKAEGDMSCEDFITELIDKHMNMKTRPGAGSPIIIERAHRIGSVANNTKPRPVIARVLNWRDRVFILKNAPAILKKNKYKGNPLFIGDDVSQNIRKQRQVLTEHMKKLRAQNKFAYIPYSIPPVLVTKNGNGDFIRIHPKDLPTN